MEKKTAKEALRYLTSEYVKTGTLTLHPSTKVFGEKGGHKAFCTARYEFKKGGADKSFEISKKTYDELKATGLFKIGKSL